MLLRRFWPISALSWGTPARGRQGVRIICQNRRWQQDERRRREKVSPRPFASGCWSSMRFVHAAPCSGVSRCLHFSHAAQRRAQRRVSAILNKRQEILSSLVAVHPLWAPHEHFFRGKQSLWSSSSSSTALLWPVALPNGLDTITSFRANAFH